MAAAHPAVKRGMFEKGSHGCSAIPQTFQVLPGFGGAFCSGYNNPPLTTGELSTRSLPSGPTGPRLNLLTQLADLSSRTI